MFLGLLPGIASKVPGALAFRPPPVPTPPGGGLISSGILGGIAGGALASVIWDLLFPERTAEATLDKIPPEFLKPPGSGTEIAPGQPEVPTDYFGGTQPVRYRMQYRLPIISGGDLQGWGPVSVWFRAADGPLSNPVMYVNDDADEDLQHWSFDGLGEEPHIGDRNKDYDVDVTEGDGNVKRIFASSGFGLWVVGFVDADTEEPIPDDQYYVPGSGADPIISVPDPIIPANPREAPPGEPDLFPLPPSQDALPVPQSAQDLGKDIAEAPGFDPDRVAEDSTDILGSPGLSGGGQKAPPVPTPDLPPIVTPDEVPEIIPEIDPTSGGEKLVEELTELVPPLLPLPPAVEDFIPTPGIKPLPGGSFLEIILKQIELCCAEQQEADCCDEILAKLNELQETIDNIEEIAEEIDWQVNPPLPGSGDLGSGTIGATSGGSWTSLGNLVWVQLIMVVEPPTKYLLQFGNGNSPNIYITGWFIWILAGGNIHRIPIDYSNAMYPAPKGATGFAFTGTYGSQFSANYWYDNRE